MENEYYLYLVKVFLYSIPFYLLNVVKVGKLPLDLPLSFLMIFVPFGLAFQRVYQQNGLKGLLNWLSTSYSLEGLSSFKYIVFSIVLMPIIFLFVAYLKDNQIINQLFKAHIQPLEVIITFILLYLGAIVEELGWTTYLTRPFQEEIGIVQTGLLIGVVWGVWHIIPYLSQGRDAVTIISLVICSIAYRLIMGYLYQYSNYVSLTAILFHTMINFCPEILPQKYQSIHFPVLALTVTIFAIICVIADTYHNGLGLY